MFFEKVRLISRRLERENLLWEKPFRWSFPAVLNTPVMEDWKYRGHFQPSKLTPQSSISILGSSVNSKAMKGSWLRPWSMDRPDPFMAANHWRNESRLLNVSISSSAWKSLDIPLFSMTRKYRCKILLIWSQCDGLKRVWLTCGVWTMNNRYASKNGGIIRWLACWVLVAEGACAREVELCWGLFARCGSQSLYRLS